MITTNYSVNSIGFRGFLNSGRSLTNAAKEAVEMAKVSSNASKSSRCILNKSTEVASNISKSHGCILKGKSTEVVEKVEKEINKKGLLKTGITGPIY